MQCVLDVSSAMRVGDGFFSIHSDHWQLTRQAGYAARSAQRLEYTYEFEVAFGSDAARAARLVQKRIEFGD